ncbi:hypothetical protein HQ487_01210 [Candidatus Uhrbacteria bacterium]|nr:hypothetical protein [Candidatus Uhrbacteria bacterium]
MTDTNLSYTPEDLFKEVVARCHEQGVAEEGAYNGMVEEVIEGHRRVGEIHDDAGTEDLEEQMRGRFQEYKATLE